MREGGKGVSPYIKGWKPESIHCTKPVTFNRPHYVRRQELYELRSRQELYELTTCVTEQEVTRRTSRSGPTGDGVVGFNVLFFTPPLGLGWVLDLGFGRLHVELRLDGSDRLGGSRVDFNGHSQSYSRTITLGDSTPLKTVIPPLLTKCRY